MTPAIEVAIVTALSFFPHCQGPHLLQNAKQEVARVKGSDPEQFFIFLINTTGSPFMRTSDFLSEKGLRSDLANRGIKEAEIEALIEHSPSLASAKA
jgi:hypothetical protein